MTITHHPGYLPFVANFLPDVHEPEGAAIELAVFHVTKPVSPDFHGTIIRNRIHFKTTRHQFSSQAIIKCSRCCHAFYSIVVVGKAALVMVKFQVPREKLIEGDSIPVVKSIEQYLIHLADLCVKAIVSHFSLRAELAASRNQEEQEKEKINLIVHNLPFA